MKHLGDITKINGQDVPAVNIVVGGSPCQDLSVAGKREGLAGQRSGLFMEQIRIIKEMRENDRTNKGADVDIRYIRPRFMVWENVPGAFSSNKGEDFRIVLEETAKIVCEDAVIPRPPKNKWQPSGCIMGDGWSIAWRLHDAQFWGVPQRRKRIALVADFGGESAPKILFESKSLFGDSEESGEEGQEVARAVEDGIGKTGEYADAYTLKVRGEVEIDSAGKRADKGALIQTELSGTLGVSQDQTLICREPTICLNDQGGAQMDVSEEVTGTLRAQDHGHAPVVIDQGINKSYGFDGYNQTIEEEVAQPLRAADGGDSTPKVVCIEGNGSRPSHKGNGYAETDTMYTLNSTEKHVVAYRGDAITSPVNASNPQPGDPCHTLTNDGRNYVVLENHPADSRVKISDDNIVQTLSGRMETGGGNVPMVMGEAYCVGNGQLSQARISDKVGALNCMHDQQAVLRGIDGDVAGTLDASYYKGCGERQGVERTVVYGLDRASYNQGINAKYDFSVEAEKIATQTAKGPGAVYNNYIVRRLTPLECERLQGFPTIRKVRFTEMTKDEYIAWNINEGHIVVDTEYGKVFATRGQGGIKLDEPKELMGSVVNGYRVVSIRNGNTKMQCRVHRIVWIAEHGVIPDGYVIDHINNDKQDNRLCNLQLLTPKENSTKARADDLYKIHGEAGQSKITDEVHDFIQYVYGNTDLSIRQLSEIFGISKSRVHQIIHDEAWTNIGDWIDSKGKKHKGEADAPRYKALGNSIALPFWQWMAERMVNVLKEDEIENPTMASLFDGIGGFPLVYSRCGCEPVWASEIEEFPIAVTKIRFPDN